MTHLGLNSAAAVAERGCEAICFDPDAAVVAQLKAEETLIVEPELNEYLVRNKALLKYTDNPQDIAICDVVYISVDVPTDDTGKSDLNSVLSLIKIATAHLSPSAVLVILCQVPPGFTRDLNIPLDRLFYQVETLVFGQAIKRAMYPERIIVGCAAPANPLPEAYRVLLEAFDCPILPMGYESAELAKIAINCCLVSSISVANTLAELCESLGADWSDIVPALKLDRRIGAHAYLTPGLGIAGGNLERDLETVIRLASLHNSDHGVVDAWLANSRHRRDWVRNTLQRHVFSVNRDPSIAILGLAYKQDTRSTKNSPALALLEDLKDNRVRVFDPAVPATIARSATGAENALEAAANSDVLIVMTPWKEFSEITVNDLLAKMSGRCIIDPYRVLDGDALTDAGFLYVALGAPPLKQRHGDQDDA